MVIQKLRVASIFCGCGGLDYAFHNNINFEVVYANDFNKDACKTYETYYKFTPECKNIKDVNTIPDCDIMLGGFPCQGFSVVNPYRDVNDDRNELYFELLRLLRKKQPKYFIFENVKGIMSIGGYETSIDKKNKTGRIFKLIVNDFEQCGYNVKTKLVQMKYYGIPQNRERVIFIGIRKDIHKPFKWFNENKNDIKTLRDVIYDLPLEYNSSIQHVGSKHKVKLTGYVGNRKLNWDCVSPTIMGRGGGTGGAVINIHPSMTRRMTVREYARIQTFPDDFMFSGSISSMYRQIGNAVPPKFSTLLAQLIVNINL